MTPSMKPGYNPAPVSLRGPDLEKWGQPRSEAATSAMLESFHVDIEKGAVWVGDRRVLVLQAEWFLDMRRALMDAIGAEGTRAILTRSGYSAGVRDAHLAMKLNPKFGPLDLITTGGAFHALQGSARAVRHVVELDLASKHCYLEFSWLYSVEDEKPPSSHARDAGHESCWMETGYASGFLSTCIGGAIIVRELECASGGAAECRCVARFAHEWGDVAQDVRYLDPGYAPWETALRPMRRQREDLVPVGGGTRDAQMSALVAGSSLIGRSASFEAVVKQARRVGKTTATVLLLGESGVGKSALARFIHEGSARTGGPFVEVNCAAIPDALLESELFGVERGAFTGATSSRKGRFEEANGGTLFLDEVGLLPPAAQGKLLRVLQSQKFERLGSSQTQQADVRLLAATNNDLGDAVREGTFRADLFYRLNVFPITLPPLRHRLGDLPLFIDQLVTNFCTRYERSLKGITPQAYRAMLHHDWPGNIRELENVLERAVILVDDDEAIDLHHIFTSDPAFRRTGLHWLDEKGQVLGVTGKAQSGMPADPGSAATAGDPWMEQAIHQTNHSLDDIEQAVVLAALKMFDGNLIRTAQHLGVTRAQVDYRLKKWGIDPRLLGDS